MSSSDSKRETKVQYRYFALEDAIEIHRLTVEKSGGGALGHLEVEKLGSVLQFIQDDDYYPSFEDKLAHLFHSACQFHCFEDGNKRIAISLCAYLLLINGYVWVARGFMQRAENISYHVAAGRIDKTLLKRAFSAMIDGRFDDDESLKLDLFRAMSGE